jgi:hypothetical protein
MAELPVLRDYVQALCADGWVIAASSPLGSVEHSALQRNAAEARKFIPSRRWRIFSEFVESAIQVGRELAPVGEQGLTPSAAGGCEESAGAQ